MKIQAHVSPDPLEQTVQRRILTSALTRVGQLLGQPSFTDTVTVPAQSVAIPFSLERVLNGSVSEAEATAALTFSLMQLARPHVQRTLLDVDAGKRSVNLGGGSVDPVFERRARDFELKLAPLAIRKSERIRAKMCTKALGYLERRAAHTVQTLDQLLAMCGEASEAFAGAIGSDPQLIRQILLTEEQIKAARDAAAKGLDVPDPPSVREQMTFIRNFQRSVLAPDIVEHGAAKVAEFLGDATLTAEIERRAQAARAKKAELVKAAEAAGKAVDAKKLKEAEDKAVFDFNPNEAIYTTANQDNARVDITDVIDLTNPERTALAGETEAQRKARHKAQDRALATSTRTVADIEAEDATLKLTSRELAHMGLSGGGQLKWNEGARAWLANEKNAWVQSIRALSLPFAAAPSGMTNSYLNATRMMLGDSPRDLEEARLACIGHLIHIRAHSMAECLQAAGGYGVPFKLGPKMYRELEPLGEDALRACGRVGPKGTRLFPDEPDA